LKTVTRLKDWSELIPSELAAAQTLQLDESSWPRFNDDDGEPEHVVRHSARTTIFWRDLTEAEREAAHQVGFDESVWKAFHRSKNDSEHQWYMDECQGDSGCWGDVNRQGFVSGMDRNVYRCGRGCVKIRCPNFEVCRYEGAGFFVNMKGRCLDCDITYGENFDILRGDAVDSAEDCSICFAEKAVVKLPQCAHRFCGDCTDKLYEPDDDGVSHMCATDGGVNDKGCPLCRGDTLVPTWVR